MGGPSGNLLSSAPPIEPRGARGMNPRRAYARKIEIARAIEALRACGLDVGSVRLSADGGIEIIERGSVSTPSNDFDRLEDQL